ncbi:DUF2243 domain-containing protein [Arthrobacter sp. Br18]|uniref:DUF2243 domain-containing protein n=1 Tax=Arthrobacter sp. Br18 TaxID=1312954 RepID=UPI0004B950E8|nr:DUF2243 domain-containing protein [Arthrobacter sp. Br18]
MRLNAAAGPGLRSSVVSGLLFGCGLVAFVDEAVFHQILSWHHFYDRSTSAAGLVSDGVFHAFSWGATVCALFLFADLRHRRLLSLPVWTGGVLLGAGVFQLYDGVVQHKVFGLHQIRYGVDLAMYDLLWNLTAVVLIVSGAAVLLVQRRRSGRTARPPG